MSFPLRRLPIVVLSILFNCLLPDELIRLSFLSRKCYALTKALRKKPKNGLCFILRSSAAIEFEDTNSKSFEVYEFSDIPRDAQLEFLVIGDALPCFVSMNRERDGMDIYCQYDRFEGLTALSKYITDFYELPIEKISIGADKHSNDPKRALDWVFSQQETLDECYFGYEKSEAEELLCLFDKIENRVKNVLNVYVWVNDDFRYTFRQPLTADVIEFGVVKWLTIDNLYALNSRLLWTRMTNLTSEDMNSFFKNWLNGGNSNLRHLITCITSVNADTIFDGLDVIHRNHPVEIKYYLEKEEAPSSFDSWYELKRSDGTIASIVLEDLPNFINMCVWPDIHGRPYPVQELDL